MAAPQEIISLKELGFSYLMPGQEPVRALADINLSVRHGEYLALLGPGGSGKTTLLKLCNALLRPSTGGVTVNGVVIASGEEREPDEESLALVRRSCGMIFQNPDNQLVATTVEEDIAFGLENLALPPAEIRRRVQETAMQLGLEKLLKQPPHLLSGGEKQRVAIAGVLAMEPLCLLMDEPTAMLDPLGRRAVLETVQSLNRERGLAVIHVTHFPEEAALADRVVVLKGGRLHAEGPSEIILSHSRTLQELGLTGTVAAELAALLRRDGFPLPPGIIHNGELVESLCSWARKK